MQNSNDKHRFDIQRRNLVASLQRKGIGHQEVLRAIGKVPRHQFFRSDLRRFSYFDKAYPIGSGQTISQPYTVAFQTELLLIEPGMKVLEIGTGSGYQSAILCEMGAKVFSIERQKVLFNATPLLLNRLGYCVKLFYGDGYVGVPSEAPFDRIILTAAAPEIPENLLSQLREGGIMVAPVGKKQQTMMRITHTENREFNVEEFGTFVFVPMLNGVE